MALPLAGDTSLEASSSLTPSPLDGAGAALVFVIDHTFDETTDGIRILEAALLAGAHSLDDAGQPPVGIAGGPNHKGDAGGHRLFGGRVHAEDRAVRPSTRREGQP